MSLEDPREHSEVDTKASFVGEYNSDELLKTQDVIQSESGNQPSEPITSSNSELNPDEQVSIHTCC